MSRPFWTRHLPIVLVPAALSVLVFGYRLGATGFWTDESIYAQSAREMAWTGEWVTPTLCGKPYLIKPVLYHWLASASFHLFGENELAGRLPQAVAGFVGIAAVAGFAGRLFGRNIGILSGAALATCPGYAVGARVAGMDILLTTCVSLSLGSFLLGYENPRGRRAWFLASGFCAGLAALAKGPLGAGIPAMVILAFLLWRREPGVAFSRPALQGLAAGLAVASVWYWPVWIRHGGGFTRIFWLQNNLLRITEPVHEHAGPASYYLPVVFLAFLPWSLPLTLVLIRSAGRLVRQASPGLPAVAFLWIWFLAPLAFYSLIATKLPGYILPIFPAAAILTAREWVDSRRSSQSRKEWGFRAACALGAVSLPGVALAVPFLLQHRYGIPPARAWIFPAVTFPLAAIAALSALTDRGRLRSLWWVAAGAVFVLSLVRFALVPADPYESMKEMTGRLLKEREAGYPVALAGGHLKGTLFYTGCSVPMPRDINDLPRPGVGHPLYCLVKKRFRPSLEGWANRGGFAIREVESRGLLSLVEVSRSGGDLDPSGRVE